ncbi:MAG: hypothetical protein LDL30_13085 [Desulfovibrio sp.]|nr:hypothetical protein [Desulfovibrio sp.]
MAEGPKYPLKIKYEYVGAENVRPTLVHGVWGGINAHGEIEMNFYTESDKLPETSEQLVHPDGQVGPEIAALDEESRCVVRRIDQRIIVSYQTARALLDWLEEKVQALELEGEGAPYFFDEGKGPAQ